MTKIRIIGLDPSTSNWGMAIALLDIDTLDFEIEKFILVTTESESKKGVVKHSDDLRRAKIVYEGMQAATEGVSLAISEIPFCNPGGYASANFNSGLVTGVLSSLKIPLIQVSPREVKVAATGISSATKGEMIDWAIAKFPDAPWLMRKLKGVMVPTNANEHLADSVAAIVAGIKTEQFKQALSMMRSMIKGST